MNNEPAIWLQGYSRGDVFRHTGLRKNETPAGSSKSQNPNPKQISTPRKSQTPKGSAVRILPFDYCDLEFPWDLELGVWDFRGVSRRFERLGQTPAGAVVYDDYAHHPTEVAATLRAARTLEPQRLVAVFQPHLYSRTAALWRQFGSALALADVPGVVEIYPARERADDFPGITGLLVAEAAADAAGGRPVLWLADDGTRLPVGVSTRIGITKAADAAHRYYARGNPSVSGTRALSP